MNYRILKLATFISVGIFSLLNIKTSFALIPPSKEVLESAFNGSEEVNYDRNTDVYFVYEGISIDRVKSEDKLRELVEQANRDTLNTEKGMWGVREFDIESQEYYERYLLYDKKGELYEASAGIYDTKDRTTVFLMSQLLGEQYNINMKNILLLGTDRNTPFVSELLVKVFEDNSVKIGVLYDVDWSDLHIKKGWYSLDEIKQFLREWDLNNGNDLGYNIKWILTGIGILAVMGAAVFMIYNRFKA